MPANTPYANLPYPLDPDAVADGADAVKNLADALDPPWANLFVSAGQSMTGPGSAYVSWDPNGAGSAATPEFTIVNGTGTRTKLLYSGPTRWFHFMASGNSGLISTSLKKNGANLHNGANEGNAPEGLSVAGMIPALAAGDYLEMQISSAFTFGATNFLNLHMALRAML